MNFGNEFKCVRTNGSPGDYNLIRSGLATASQSFLGYPLKGAINLIGSIHIYHLATIFRFTSLGVNRFGRR